MQRKTPTTIDGIVHWYCARCKSWQPETNFYKNKQTFNGLCCYCKPCHIRLANETHNPDLHRIQHRDSMRRSRQKDPQKFRDRNRKNRKPIPKEKDQAHVLVRQALKSGILTKPEGCSRCKKIGKVHAHHSDYTKPLNVEWLCPTCHGEVTFLERRNP